MSRFDPQVTSREFDYVLKLVFVGDEKVGKTHTLAKMAQVQSIFGKHGKKKKMEFKLMPGSSGSDAKECETFATRKSKIGLDYLGNVYKSQDEEGIKVKV